MTKYFRVQSVNLMKIAITAAGVLIGHRKLYRKARSLLNCMDTKSELKLVLSVAKYVLPAWKRCLH